MAFKLKKDYAPAFTKNRVNLSMSLRAAIKYYEISAEVEAEIQDYAESKYIPGDQGQSLHPWPVASGTVLMYLLSNLVNRMKKENPDALEECILYAFEEAQNYIDQNSMAYDEDVTQEALYRWNLNQHKRAVHDIKVGRPERIRTLKLRAQQVRDKIEQVRYERATRAAKQQRYRDIQKQPDRYV